MRPFLYFRRWWRRTSEANRALTSVAVLVVVALAAWIFTPTGGADSDVTDGVATGSVDGPTEATDAGGLPLAGDAAEAGAAPGSTDAGGATTPASGDSGATTAGGGSAQAAGGPTAGSSGGTGGKKCLTAPSGTPGVTDETITIAAIVLNLAGPIGNTSQGLATPEAFRQMGDAVAGEINARGGVQCRKLVMKYYDANPLSQDQQRSVCLQVTQDRPFMSVDFAGFAFPPSAAACLPQQKIPFIGVNLLLPTDFQRFQPYLATINGNASIVVRDSVLAMKERGFFDPAKGFKKLGILADECAPEVNRAFDAALAEAGVTGASKFSFACPTGGFGAPNEMNQAVTQHRLDGVSHVIPLTGSGSFNTYTNIAQGQRYRPMYGITDYGNIPTSQGGNQKANAENFNDNNLIISTTRRGQESPGIKQDPATERCQAVLVKAGLPASHVFQPGGGFVCSHLWTIEAALTNARGLTREQALPGLFSAGPIALAYPSLDTTFRGPLKFHGGDSWWPVQYQGGCACFRPLDTTRRPSFAR